VWKTYLKESLPSLIVIVVFMLLGCGIYRFFIFDYIFLNAIGYAMKGEMFGFDWLVASDAFYYSTGLVTAFIFNFLAVYLIPAITAVGIETKKNQYKTGFIISLVAVILPLILMLPFSFNVLTWFLFFGMYILIYPVTFIVSALFVSPVYKGGFRFKS